MSDSEASQVSSAEPGQGVLQRLAGRWNSMRLSTKAMLLTVVLATLVISVIFITLSLEIRDEIKQILRDTLNRTEQQVLSIKEDNLAQLIWVSSQISSNPTLRAAMETYRLEASMNMAVHAELLATLKNELDKIWPGLQHDLLIVTDEKGSVLAANGEDETRPDIGADLSGLAVLSHALDPAAEMGDESFGVITLEGQYFLIGSLPIEMQGYIIGTLTLGDRIDSSFLPNLRRFFGGDTLITVGGRVIASTLTAASDSSPKGTSVDSPGVPAIGRDGTVRIGSDDYLVTTMSLGTDDAGEPVTLYLLRSLTDALREPNRSLMKTLATQGALAVLLVALLAWVTTRASLQPLARFVAFMKGVAESGDYSLRFRGRRGKSEPPPAAGETPEPPEPLPSSGNELDLLVDGFNRMLAVIEARDSSLKRAHTQLEDSVEALQQKEIELRQMQKMEAIGLLAGGVAHDFNNTLMVISGFSELALRGLEPDHPAREFIEEVRQATNSGVTLTRQLLAVSSRQVLEPRVIRLNDLVEGIENMLQRALGESIELKTRLEPGLHNVVVDPAQIDQTLLNLVLNSRDAIDESGTITISTANVDPGEVSDRLELEIPHVMISVRDTGCGISEDVQAHMFEPFFTTKDKGKGTGLGLSTVHGTVKQCGGHILVESRPGAGAEFRIYLPAVAEDIDQPSGHHYSGQTGGEATLLLVEDDKDVRAVVSKMLSMSGFAVIEAEDPIQALRLFEQHRDVIDVLITDVVMPGMNGKQLYERIAAVNPDIKTLFISAYADGAIDDLGDLREGVSFLQKPFTPEALLAKLQQILESSVTG